MAGATVARGGTAEARLERPIGRPPLGRDPFRPAEPRPRPPERPARRELGPVSASSADRSVAAAVNHLPSPWRGATCRIRPLARTVTSSAPVPRPRFRLEFEPVRPSLPDRLMGWSGGGDPRDQVRLDFPSAEAAIAWAARYGLEVDQVPYRPRTARPRPYAETLHRP